MNHLGHTINIDMDNYLPTDAYLLDIAPILGNIIPKYLTYIKIYSFFKFG